MTTRTLFGERDPDEIDAPRWPVERVTIDDEPRAPVEVDRLALLAGLDCPPPVDVPAVTPLDDLPEPDQIERAPRLPRPEVPPPPTQGPYVDVWHGQPWTPMERDTCIAAALTDETRDPCWWRSRLPGVSFELTIWPDGQPMDGKDHTPSECVGTFGPDSIIQIRASHGYLSIGGKLRRITVQRYHDDGSPVYAVSLADLAVWSAPERTEKQGMPAHLRERSRA